MGRSISLMEGAAINSSEGNGGSNPFHMNRTGYAYFTADANHGKELAAIAERAQSMGAGTVRHHTSAATYAMSLSKSTAPTKLFQSGGAATSGFDVVNGNDNIRKIFPYIGPTATTLVHARRAGKSHAYFP
jgi:hypothetical protein